MSIYTEFASRFYEIGWGEEALRAEQEIMATHAARLPFLIEWMNDQRRRPGSRFTALLSFLSDAELQELASVAIVMLADEPRNTRRTPGNVVEVARRQLPDIPALKALQPDEEQTFTGGPGPVFHVVFELDYCIQDDPRHEMVSLHPTWGRQPDGSVETTARYGGDNASVCVLCGRDLAQLILLDHCLVELGVTSVPLLQLVVCLSCLAFEEGHLEYRHSQQGDVSSIGVAGMERHDPRFVAPCFPQTTVGLLAAAPRWMIQDIEDRETENLHRLGGSPGWVQFEDRPACPVCDLPMTFLYQSASGTCTAEGGRWLWGSGGMAYFHWCDSCSVSSVSGQWT